MSADAVFRLEVDEARIAALVDRHAGRHRDHHHDEALAEAADGLRARAQAILDSHGENADPLAEAIWKRCARHPEAPATCADPRSIAVVAYEVVADLLGAARDETERPGTEAPDVSG